MNQLEVLSRTQSILQQLPLVPAVFYTTLVLWGVFSLVLFYHWITYARNPLVAAATLGIYTLGSLFIIGRILVLIHGIYI